MTPRIWTFETRDLLYQRLTMQFGPRREWETTSRPGRLLDAAYAKFLRSFAEMIGAKSPDAVQQQINFTAPITGDVRLFKKPHVIAMTLNLAAALKAGFIEPSEFPICIAIGGPDAWDHPAVPTKAINAAIIQRSMQ
jgi:hypothetical protein